MVDNQQDLSINSVMNDEQSDQNHRSDEYKDGKDEFLRVTAAHQVLIEAQTHEEQENYPLALHLYRNCVDFLLEELMFAEGTDQSRIYLREKCSAIMDRIDLLKSKLEPITPSITNEESTNNQLESLQIN